MKPKTTQNFNEILKTIQTSKQKILQNEKLSPVLRELQHYVGYKGKINAT